MRVTEAHHEFASERVERAGGLVRKQYVRVSDETAGQCDTLRLTARHLSGPMTFQVIELEPLEPRSCRSKSLLTANPGKQERQGDVLLCGEFWDELAELEHEAESFPPQSAAIAFAQCVETLTIEVDLTGVRCEYAREAVQQG